MSLSFSACSLNSLPNVIGRRQLPHAMQERPEFRIRPSTIFNAVDDLRAVIREKVFHRAGRNHAELLLGKIALEQPLDRSPGYIGISPTCLDHGSGDVLLSTLELRQ